MKISIVTVCYNSERTIQRTIDSIKKQGYYNLEYIIIDGLSTDTTVDIIKNNLEELKRLGINTKFISEKDTGIYNAMNKGLKNCTGEIIGILNSDDYYLENTLKKVQNNFVNTEILIGDMKVFSKTKKDKTIISKLELNKRMTVCHPATFVKKEVYEKIGIFNENFKIAADYDFISRCYRNKIKIKLIHDVLVMMELEGISNQKKYLKKIMSENMKVRQINDFGKINNFIYFFRDFISVLIRSLKKGE